MASFSDPAHLASRLSPDNPQQISRVPVFIRVLDVNDNAPAFAANYETFVCENAKANQVGVAVGINKTLVSSSAGSH